MGDVTMRPRDGKVTGHQLTGRASRRRFLRGLAATGLALLAVGAPAATTANGSKD
jgi:hypothetical protein